MIPKIALRFLTICICYLLSAICYLQEVQAAPVRGRVGVSQAGSTGARAPVAAAAVAAAATYEPEPEPAYEQSYEPRIHI